MQRLSVALLAAGLSASILSAQAGPGTRGTFAADAVLTTAALDALNPPAGKIYGATKGNLTQVNASKKGKLPLGAGQFYVTLTVNALSTPYGGNFARGGILGGVYDMTNKASPTFTPDTLCNNLNDIAGGQNAFGGMIEQRDGLFACVDWANGPQATWRQTALQPFPVCVPITATGTTPIGGPYIDPALAYVCGNLVMFYTDGSQIGYRPCTVTFNGGNTAMTAMSVGNPVVVVTGNTPHSPSPFIDSLGNCTGLLYSVAVGGDSDMSFKAGLDATDPGIQIADNAAWLNNGGNCGGRFLFANSGDYTKILDLDACWLDGSTTTIGTGTATITVGCFNSTTFPATTTLGLALDLTLSPPFAVPGIDGFYALGANPFVFASAVSNNADDLAGWTSPVPNDPALKALAIPVQGLTAIPTLKSIWTSTSFLRFK